MPYKTTSELPDSVKSVLPAHAQEIYMGAFNGAFDQYDGDEEKSHATAWAAVKKEYKQDAEGKWVAKESDIITTGGEGTGLSSENKRAVLQAAVQTRFGAEDRHAWIEDMTDTEVVYNLDGLTYKAPYTIENGEVAIGEPVKVVRQTIYVTAETIRKAYGDLVALASTRPAKAIADHFQKATEAFNKAELPPEDMGPDTSGRPIPGADKAIKAIGEAIAAVVLLEAVKTEDGQEFPAAAYAYVPDAEKPSSWKLRLWEDPTKKVTRRQLGAAAAALSPGGFRGQRASIPADDLPAVKRKIRAAYRKLGVEDEDIPRWVMEADMRELIVNFIPLTEADITTKGRGQVVVIKPGFNASKARYYPKEVLERDHHIFEGVKMYADHASEREERERPERSIRDWVAVLKNVKVRGSDGAIVGEYNIVEPWMEAKLAKLRDAGELDKIGISINAVGKLTRQNVESVDTNVVEKLVAARSVDFVTEPGAGGSVEVFESRDPMLDVDLVDMAHFRERRPDIVKAIEEDARNEIIKEAKRKMELEKENEEQKKQIQTLTEERDTLQAKVTEGEKAKVKANAQAKIKEAVGKAELPEPSKARLLERFKEADTDTGITEAIKAEQDYIATLAEAGKVKGLGSSEPENQKKADRDALKQSFMESGMNEKEAEIAAEGR